LQDGFFGPR